MKPITAIVSEICLLDGAIFGNTRPFSHPTVFPFVGAASSNQFIVPANFGESCPRDVLTFNCTIAGGGVTIWRGTAFNCPASGNEILLRHTQFAGGNAMGSCNGGSISARGSQNTANMCFTSLLSVTISNQLNNKTIECAHDSGSQRTIDVVTITVLTGTNIKL